MVFFTMDNVIIFLTAIHVGFFKTGEVHQDLQRQWTVLHHVIYCLTGNHQGIAFAPHMKQEILLGLVQTGENIAIQGREISTSIFSLKGVICHHGIWQAHPLVMTGLLNWKRALFFMLDSGSFWCWPLHRNTIMLRNDTYWQFTLPNASCWLLNFITGFLNMVDSFRVSLRTFLGCVWLASWILVHLWKEPEKREAAY
jgi:hypothetical protein